MPEEALSGMRVFIAVQIAYATGIEYTSHARRRTPRGTAPFSDKVRCGIACAVAPRIGALSLISSILFSLCRLPLSIPSHTSLRK